MAIYETVGREGEPVSAIGTKPICESDRKVHWFASENLFISQNNTLFHVIFDAHSRKTIGIVELHVVLKIYTKNTWKYVIFIVLQNYKQFFYLKNIYFWEHYRCF